ncbi:MAG TPA: zinc ribbon domain-containing protein [Woeseiaceae bacterium]|jgi:putative FmdB family regulatory protein|nr:zinc ribbon domain-containing protein [Woeseiaceae bacterium]
MIAWSSATLPRETPMPIYEYICKSCEHTFDALQKISDAPLVDCPDCGEASLQKALSAPKFRLKGSGWYETDFKTGGKRNLHASDSDTKPEKKADEKADKKADKKD